MKTRSHALLGCTGTCLVVGRQYVKVAVIDVQAYALRLKTPNTQPKTPTPNPQPPKPKLTRAHSGIAAQRIRMLGPV